MTPLNLIDLDTMRPKSQRSRSQSQYIAVHVFLPYIR